MLAFGTRLRRVLGDTVLESMLIGTLGTLVGLGLGLALLGWIINVVSRDTYPELGLPITLTPASIATAVAPGIVAVAVAPLLSTRRLKNMDLPATIRVVE